MPVLYGTIKSPQLGNVFLDALLGPAVYDRAAYSNSPIYYVLQGKPGSNGYDGLGGSAWASNGAATAFVKAANAWTAVSGISLKASPFYYDGTGSPGISNWVETLSYLGSDSDELGRHETPVAGTFAHNLLLYGSFNAQSSVFNATNNAVGGYSFTTFLHEIGHALGLDHPHDGALFPGVTSQSSLGDFSLNQGIFTVMSYNDGYVAKGLSPTLAYGWMSTPGAFDIAAVQAVYGANMATNATDSVYRLPLLNQGGTAYACIWDAGGTDTISADGSTISCTIDLNPATLRAEIGGGGFLSSAAGIFGGFTIANGAQIENAIGGNADDVLKGNSLDNFLSGAGGVDRLDGSDGDDTLDGGAGSDTLDGGSGNDRIIYDEADAAANVLGGAGIDTLVVNGDMLPNGFDLTAQSFEVGEQNKTDPGGHSWSTIRNIYTPGWQLLQQTQVNDDASKVVVDFDLANIQSFTSQLSYFDTQGRIDFYDVNKDGGSRVIVDIDQDNSQSYNSQLIYFDMQGYIDFYDINKDDGTRVIVDFDQDNSQSHNSQLIYSDTQGHVDFYDINKDDGTRVIVDFDQDNSQSYNSQLVYFDNQGLIDFYDINKDDGTRVIVDIDQANNQSYISQLIYFDALGRVDFYDINLDDNTRVIVDFDQGNNHNFVSQLIYFDTENRIDFYDTNNDDGTRVIADLDQNDSQPWSQHVILYAADQSTIIQDYFLI